MPRVTQKPSVKLRTGQIRVLQALALGGCLTRSKIAGRMGSSDVYVGKSVGMRDPAKRLAFEQTKDGGGEPGKPHPSLLTLGYVREVVLDIDGVEESSYEITPAGRAAFAALGDVNLSPLRD